MNDEALEVVRTIWRQIPISSKMACGMRELTVVDERTLRVRVNHGRAHQYLLVRLDGGGDTYTVMLEERKPRKDLVVLAVQDGVYCDNLNAVVYHMVNNFVNKP